jgi:prevent-host-death family protein
MATMSAKDAGKQLDRLIDRVLMGEELVITKEGRPAAKLVRIAPKARRRTPGTARDLISIASEFDVPLTGEIRRRFE